jgi:hypothetical protein
MSKMMKKGGKAASGVMKDAMGTKKKSTKKAS